MPRHTDPYSGRTFIGVPGREALVFDARDNGRTVTDLRCQGGSTCLRLFECGNITLINPNLRQPFGPGDSAGGSDGQCLQIIRPTGPIRIFNPRFVASAAAEDLLSIYADKPCAGSVYVENGEWYGRGTSNSSTSICLDGPYAPTTEIKGGDINGARCGLTIAGGILHVIDSPQFEECETKIYVYAGYRLRPTVTFRKIAKQDVEVGVGAGTITWTA